MLAGSLQSAAVLATCGHSVTIRLWLKPRAIIAGPISFSVSELSRVGLPLRLVFLSMGEAVDPL